MTNENPVNIINEPPNENISQNINTETHNEPNIFQSSTFGTQLSLRVDEDVGAMSISPSYRDVVLASRSGLFIIDLDDPFSQPRYLPHRTSWEVADVQWSPHVSKSNWVISTSNQKALVWNLALPSEKAVEHVLHGHTRAITDINFSPDPEVLATCSVDSFVHMWDMRTAQKPVQSFANWYAAATQVKFNRKNFNIVGSTHGKTLFIWDKRKGSVPLHQIDAHLERINGLDFSRIHETKLLTCSSDHTVKSWDYSTSDTQPQAIIQTRFPVWKARHTPFGQGCCILPARGGNNSVFLHDLTNLEGEVEMTPTYEFRGHSQVVKEFLWRSRGISRIYEDREFQLVTWSKDNAIRLWPVTESTLETVHYQKGAKLQVNLTRFGAKYETYRKEPISDNYLQKLQGKSLRANSSNVHKETAFMTGTRPSIREKLANYSNSETNRNEHLNWMSGVRIGKSAFDQFTGANTQSSVYETPGNLGEEVTMVGHKFPKIRFENISVSTGEIKLSLTGPWGESEELVFLRAAFIFPSNYPLGPPEITIEENNEISSEIRQQMSENLKEIASTMAERGKYSLELCLRYLLGDKIDLKEIKRQVDEMENILEELDDVFEEDILYGSSDEEKHVAGDDDLDEFEDDDLLGMGIMEEEESKKKRFDSTPLPKGCGASWSKFGHLVCFFLNKKDKFKGTMKVVADLDVSLEDTGVSDDSDSFESESDDSFGAPSKKTAPENRRALFNPARNIFNLKHMDVRASDQLNTLTEYSLDFHGSKRNYVRILDYRSLMLARVELAAGYELVDKPKDELCSANERTALKYGCLAVADAWSLLSFLLKTSMSVYQFSDWKDDTFNLTDNTGQFLWGNHPYGKNWLVKELFAYFEKEGNIQMLASMSCVLSSWENKKSSRLDIAKMAANQELRTVEFKLASLASESARKQPLRSPFNYDMLTRDNSTGYFGTSTQGTTTWNSPVEIALRPAIFETGPIERHTDHSTESSVKDTSQLASMNHTPEKNLLSNSLKSRKLGTDNQTTSTMTSTMTSPKDTRFSEGFVALRRQRPLMKRLNSDTDAISRTLSNTSIPGRGRKNSDDNPSIPVVSLEMINDDVLDNVESLPCTNTFEDLMPPELQEKSRLYRSYYAAMLYNWGLEIECLEVLKFNFTRTNDTPKKRKSDKNEIDAYYPPNIGLKGRSTHFAGDSEMMLTPDYHSTRSFPRTCQYCGLMIHTRFFVCGECQHVVHAECGEEWWMREKARECPTGCGCNCLEHITYVTEELT